MNSSQSRDEAAAPGGNTGAAAYGEDLAYNWRRATELSSIHCHGCADYHVQFAANRLTGRRRSIDSDRPRLASLLGGLLTKRAVENIGQIEIVVAGAGDTGILATAVAGARMAGEPVVERCRFSVFDLCRTPLLLCEEFGKRNGLNVRGEAVDLTSGGGSVKADLMLGHGLLRFLPRGLHAQTLRLLGAQLAPGGVLVISNRLQPASAGEGAFVSDSSEALIAMVESGAIETPEPKEQFLARIRRYSKNRGIKPENEIASLEAARALFAEAGLQALSTDVFDEAVQKTGGETVQRPRIHAVLGAPRSA